ncbi:hypothetical protein C8R44DRAFT_926046 [Mycena epipterygia]|nr:hypothetical protein C8R44DRAFT_926046 [Mycena epipterygia]
MARTCTGKHINHDRSTVRQEHERGTLDSPQGYVPTVPGYASHKTCPGRTALSTRASPRTPLTTPAASVASSILTSAKLRERCKEQRTSGLAEYSLSRQHLEDDTSRRTAVNVYVWTGGRWSERGSTLQFQQDDTRAVHAHGMIRGLSQLGPAHRISHRRRALPITNHRPRAVLRLARAYLRPRSIPVRTAYQHSRATTRQQCRIACLSVSPAWGKRDKRRGTTKNASKDGGKKGKKEKKEQDAPLKMNQLLEFARNVDPEARWKRGQEHRRDGITEKRDEEGRRREREWDNDNEPGIRREEEENEKGEGGREGRTGLYQGGAHGEWDGGYGYMDPSTYRGERLTWEAMDERRMAVNARR